MKLYVIAYFWRCVEPEVYAFTDEAAADAKYQEIISRDDYSDPDTDQGEDCITYQEVELEEGKEKIKIHPDLWFPVEEHIL